MTVLSAKETIDYMVKELAKADKRIKELESAMQEYIDGGYMDNIGTITKFKQLLNKQ